MSIRQLHLLHRHGDRSPCNLVNVYMKNLSFDCDDWEVYNGLTIEPEVRLSVKIVSGANSYAGTCMLGQLTPQGGNHLFRIGQALQEIYVDSYGLLQEPLDPSSLFVHPTQIHAPTSPP